MPIKKQINLFIALSFLVSFCGCDKSKPASAPADLKAKTEVVASVEKKDGSEELSDSQRAQQIIDRFNRAISGHYSILFGDSGVTADWQIGIDYALFNRLSDDAVAAMVAESIASRELMQNNTPDREQIKIQIASLAGEYMAKAQYDVKGYSEFLNMNKQISPQSVADSTSDHAKTDAFLRGYEMATK